MIDLLGLIEGKFLFSADGDYPFDHCLLCTTLCWLALLFALAMAGNYPALPLASMPVSAKIGCKFAKLFIGAMHDGGFGQFDGR